VLDAITDGIVDLIASMGSWSVSTAAIATIYDSVPIMPARIATVRPSMRAQSHLPRLRPLEWIVS
jgi:hypothetical protein